MTCTFFATAAFLLTSAVSAAPAPNLSGWGKPVDPDRDCKISRSGGTLTIEMFGAEHDYDPIRKRFNAPRLLRDIEGEFDLRMRLRIDSQPSSKSTVKGLPSCVSAGFLLIFSETSQSNCMRFEYGLSQPGIRLDGYAVKPLLRYPQQENASAKGIGEDGYAVTKDFFCVGRPVGMKWNHGALNLIHIMGDRGWKDWPFAKKTDSAYLRLQQRDELISFFISLDGENWTRFCASTNPSAKFKLGLAAYSTSTEPSKVRFDQLKLTRIKKDK